MKRFICLFLNCIICVLAAGQTGWQWGIGNTNANIEAMSTALDPFGNVLVSGTNSGPDTARFGSLYLYDTTTYEQLIVVKADSLGNFQWVIGSHDNNGKVRPFKIVCDSAGNSIIFGIYFGTTCSFGTINLFNPLGNNYDGMCFLLKISPVGNVLWAKNIAMENNYSGGAGIDEYGNIYITDNIYPDSITIGSTLLIKKGISSMFISKFDPSGNAIWAKSISNNSGTFSNTLAITSNGTSYVDGSYLGDTLTVGYDTITGQSSFLAKFDNNGNPKWVINLARSLTTNAMITDRFDDLYCTGSINSTTIFGPDTLTVPSASTYMCLLKCDTLGNFVWGRSGGYDTFYSPRMQGFDLKVDLCGKIWVTGMMEARTPINFSGHILDDLSGSNDPMFIVEYDNSGNYVSSMALKSGGDDWNGIMLDKKGCFYLGGDYWAVAMPFGADTLPAFSYTDGEFLFIAKYQYSPFNSLLPNPGSISGLSSVCVGSTIRLSDTIAGGTWTAGNAIATDSAGFVKGLTAGIYNIGYNVTNICGTAMAQKSITVIPLPDPGSITGPDSVCVGATITFSDTFNGGTWSAGNAIASDSVGFVKGITAGIFNISYSVTNDCGTAIVNKTVVVNPLPDPGTITGPDTVCTGATITLVDSITGGLWSSGNSIAADSFGVVKGLTAGVYTVSYSLSNHCGTAIVNKTVVVNSLPDPGTITGPGGVCVGGTIALSDTIIGGIWSAANAIAADSSGIIKGVAAGTDTICYIVTNVCGADTTSRTIKVYPRPFAGNITGPDNLCVGATAILTDTVKGGLWLYGNAFVSDSGGVLTGKAAGIGIVQFIFENSCGTDTAAKLITVNSLPVITGRISPVTCYGSGNGSVSASVSGGSGNYFFDWSNGTAAPMVNSLLPGTYSLIVTDASTKCLATDSFVISQPDSIQVFSTVNNDTCRQNKGSIIVSVTGGIFPYQFLWSNSDTLRENSGLSVGYYQLKISDSNNCLRNLSFMVEDNCGMIVIHNVITPNGDGMNDVWVIENIENYPKNIVQIFDKLGDRVYQKSDYNNDWGGEGSNGESLPDGTYFYLVKLNADNTSGGSDVFKGALLIKR